METQTSAPVLKVGKKGGAWWTLPWLPAKLRTPVYIAAGLLALGLVLLSVQYLHLAHVADRRLARGAFATTQILSSPAIISAGDSMTPSDLASRLERSGYTKSAGAGGDVGNSGPRYSLQGNKVRIVPAAQSGVEVQFDRGSVSGIVSLKDQSAVPQYQLDPEILTDLSHNERRLLVHYGDIPPSLIRALTSVEDKRFFEHGGFDYRRAVKAALVDFHDGKKQQGASTLTMQLARSLWLDRQKSWSRKLDEILITWHLEHVLSKQQIFEDYANQVYLGRRGPYSIDGFGEAARLYFGKELPQIDTAEAALLAGLVQRPTYYNPFRYPERAVSRRNLVLALMKRNGQLSDAEYRTAAAAPLKLALETADDSGTSYFLSMMNDELQNEAGESSSAVLSVVSTLDPRLQRAAEAAVRSGMAAVDRQLNGRVTPTGYGPAKPQVALVALDPHTGAIKALVGGRDYSESQLNHALASRQPGSAFKPFVYAAAIQTALNGAAKTFTPASLVSDEATTFTFGAETYQPKDFSGDYQGDVTLRMALAQSLNVAAVSLAEQVGYARVATVAHQAGLMGAQATPSVALGSYEATPVDMAAAYTVFANHGMYVKPTTIEQVRTVDGPVAGRHSPEMRQALDPRVAYITASMMQEVLRSGTGAGARSQGFALPAAGKTGTSRDGWFAGFTSELLCVVWVGFDDNRDLKLEGARSALPIWAEFMKQAARIAPYRTAHDFRAPSGVVTAEVCDETGQLAGAACSRTHNEVFIAGTEPQTYCTTHVRVTADTGR